MKEKKYGSCSGGQQKMGVNQRKNDFSWSGCQVKEDGAVVVVVEPPGPESRPGSVLQW